jgi:sugar/nucleoside kinase (ribokinase family)
VALLAEIAASPLFAAADLRVAPASPGKAERLLPFLRHARATLYVNLEEAGCSASAVPDAAATAAEALVARGAARVLVTDGARDATDARAGAEALTHPAREVQVARVTGAGDTFMAAHIAAERAAPTGWRRWPAPRTPPPPCRRRDPVMNPPLPVARSRRRAEGRAGRRARITIITHGMPWPQNVETARAVEAEIRARRGARHHRGHGRAHPHRPDDAELEALGQAPGT